MKMKAFFVSLGLYFAFYLLTLYEVVVSMRNYLKLSFFFVISSVLLLMTACFDDEVGEDPPVFPQVDRGEIEVNRYLLTFIELSDTTNKYTVEFYDPDGIGGALPTVRQKLYLKKPVSSTFFSYKSRIKLYLDNKEVTSKVVAKGTEYIICYRDYNENNIRPGKNNKDENGLNLGTELLWSTVDEGGVNEWFGNINVTLNFQPSGKNGLCDPGFRILEGSIPYQLN